MANPRLQVAGAQQAETGVLRLALHVGGVLGKDRVDRRLIPRQGTLVAEYRGVQGGVAAPLQFILEHQGVALEFGGVGQRQSEVVAYGDIGCQPHVGSIAVVSLVLVGLVGQLQALVGGKIPAEFEQGVVQVAFQALDLAVRAGNLLAAVVLDLAAADLVIVPVQVVVIGQGIDRIGDLAVGRGRVT